MGKSEHELSENDSWCTPAEVLDPIYEHFGGIGLDPFGDPSGIVCAANYFTVHDADAGYAYASRAACEQGVVVNCEIDDGGSLMRSWANRGLVFANGPFSICKDWVPKAYQEAQAGVELILLLPVRTGSNYWQSYVSRADAIIFWKGRLKFLGAKYIAPFHCALIYYGPRVETFAAAYPGHWLVTRGD